MPHSPDNFTLLIATRNAHKAGEIRAILGQHGRYRTLNDFPDAPPVVEDAATFAGNAGKKAITLARWARNISDLRFQMSNSTFILADDSGLVVDALNGAPGVHSARFAALDDDRPGNSNDAENNSKLLRLLQGVPPEKRTARFCCVLALTPVAIERDETFAPAGGDDAPAVRTQFFEGICEGRILYEARGQGGFGYDPLFVPAGYQQSFGELNREIKNRLSHRAQALAKLKVWLDAQPA